MNKEIDQLYQDGKIKEAIHLLIAKIDAHPQKIEPYLQLSTYLLEQGSNDQAQKLLEQALHLVKKPQELYYNLAVCYYSQGEFEKALQLLDQIPNDDLTLYQKALVYLKIGQGRKALAYALTIKQIDERVLELLGDIWLSLGENNAARSTFLKIDEEKRSAKVYFLLGVTTMEKDFTLAKKYFEQSKELDYKYFKQAQKQYDNLLGLINQKENHD